MSRSRKEEQQETFRTKVLEFLERLKNGVLIKYDNAEVEVLLDPSADYDVMAKRVNDSVTITVYSRYATCTVRVRVDRNGEWRLRNVVCRGRR
jgi:ABC-type transporter MlaC component